MELWIRSQDKKELIRPNRIYQFAGIIYAEAKKEVELGNYKTRERALEVLDEIQNILQPPANFIVSQHIDFADVQEGLIGVNVLKEEPKIERISDIIVYKMPKE